MEPTKEQEREFWQRCGFRFKLSASESPHYWISSNGHPMKRLPTLNLDSLYKYAVPVLTGKGYIIETLTYSGESRGIQGKSSWAIIKKGGLEVSSYSLLILKYALFWAIWDILKEEAGKF